MSDFGVLSDDVARELDRAALGPLTVDITTIGRTSGLARRIEIWIVMVDERVVIGGTPAPRDWYANVVANGTLVLHLKDAVVADLHATAAPVLDAQRRERIWTHESTKWYRRRTSVADLVALAPTVELTFQE